MSHAGGPGEAAGVDVRGTAAVELVKINKHFPGVHALQSVSLDFVAGEIHSIVGENGAGKSTLVNVLAGLVQPDTGDIWVSGRRVQFRNPRAARRGGVSVVPQDTHVIPTFSVGRTATLGLERFWVSRASVTTAERQSVQSALAHVGARKLDAAQLMAAASVAQIRLCQLARTLLDPGRLIILDEPTAALSAADAEALLDRLVALRDEGRSILYVSHRLDEVLQISDRITVLRDGAVVGTFAREDVDRAELVHLMARDTVLHGSEAAESRHPAERQERDSHSVLQVRGLTRGRTLRHVSFDVQPGEVVGIAGVQGSGHGELLELLAGAAAPDAGQILVDRQPIMTGSVKAAYRAGIRLVPQERRERGVVGARSVRENIVLGSINASGTSVLRRHRQERTQTEKMIDDLAIRTRGGETPVETLSGGNQQKVVLARMLASQPRVLLLSEPTQGIDVNAKAQILDLIRRVARERNFGIVLASSEFEEVLQYADVIHVMTEGSIVKSFGAGEARYRDVLAAALP